MAFTYADYMSSVYSPAVRVERCRLFIAELTAACVKPDVGGDGASINYTGMQSMLRDAKDDLATLEADPRARGTGSHSRAVFKR